MLAANCNLPSDWRQLVSVKDESTKSQTKVIVPVGPVVNQGEILLKLINTGAQIFLVEKKVKVSLENILRTLSNVICESKVSVVCLILEVGKTCASHQHVLQAMQGVEESGSLLGKRKAETPKYLSHDDVKNIQLISSCLDLPYILVSDCLCVKDLECIKQDLELLGLYNTKIIWKIDKWQLLEGKFRECVEASDGIMIDREALGSEWEKETDKIIKLPLIQKKIIKICNFAGKPVLVNGVVDSLSTMLRPTRAEATDVANNVLDGVDGIVLGEETSQGMYPVNVYSTVQSMCRQAEEVLDYKTHTEEIEDYLHRTQQLQELINSKYFKSIRTSELTPSASLENITQEESQSTKKLNNNLNFISFSGACYAAVKASHATKVAAIVLAVGDDKGCAQLAQFKPVCPIIVLINKGLHNKGSFNEVRGEALAARSCLFWGVQPIFIEKQPIGKSDIQYVQDIVQKELGKMAGNLVLVLRDSKGNHEIQFSPKQ
eukprot:TRINITY_DN4176_c0_g1_i4.p1 TRINITY_DN4176_c0_g1~~TRINITY_DN4176_c0_g1_i4.p1  ORF type:complete len:490 (-),score=57.23 TRINITY_DN4176_c0_g1_i4:321-1790(-)